MAHPPVLLVDGNADGLELYATALALAGITSATAASGEEAIDRITRTPPRILVTGLRLPGTPATDVIARARRSGEHVFVMALTTNEAVDRSAGRTAGCDLLLPVPCPPQTLVEQVRRLLH